MLFRSAGGMAGSAVVDGEEDMVDGAGEVGTAVGADGMVSTAAGAGMTGSAVSAGGMVEEVEEFLRPTARCIPMS